MIDYEIVYAQCCRIWPVIRFHPIGSCGICGEKPILMKVEKQDND